jgi:hypothetical protein
MTEPLPNCYCLCHERGARCETCCDGIRLAAQRYAPEVVKVLREAEDTCKKSLHVAVDAWIAAGRPGITEEK